MSQHDALKAAFETYLEENEKFTGKGVKAAAARARKALQEIAKGYEGYLETGNNDTVFGKWYG